MFLCKGEPRFWQRRPALGATRILEVFAMGGLSIWHWIIVGASCLIVFGGKGKISDIMGDVAKGIKSFKKGLAEEDDKARD